MSEMMIKTQKIRVFNPETKFTVFTAVVLKENKKTKTYKETKVVKTFTGKVISIHPNDKFLVNVQEVESRLYGKQCNIISYHRVEPGTLQEIKLYLTGINGIGPVTANKIINEHGLNTLTAISTDENALSKIGISSKIQTKIREDVVNTRCFEKILTFLQLHNIDCKYALMIFNRYGQDSVFKIKDNPYSLYIDNIIDYKTADRLHNSMNNSKNTKYRIDATVLASIRDDSYGYGNIFTEQNQVMSIIERFLSKQYSQSQSNPFTEDEITFSLQRLKKQHYITIESNENKERSVYLSANYKDERAVISGIKKALSEVKHTFFTESDVSDFISNYEKGHNIKIAKKQKEAVFNAVTQPVSILTGGPGTGKTQTCSVIISAIKTMSPNSVIKICAPTGKAALRVSEVTNMPATTIHRLLRLGGYKNEVGEDELECDFLIVDEFSMVDCNICAKLLKAICPWAKIIIIGDFEQLPSVGPGLVLRDFIGSEKIKTTRLTEIFRQKGHSNIITNAHAIINQEKDKPITLTIDKVPNQSFYFVEKNTTSNIQNTIKRSIGKLVSNYGYKQSDIRVLSPLHKTDVGTDMLNNILQDDFNPSGEIFECDDGSELRIGDPVIHTKNNYDLNVFNGETGTVKALGYDINKTLLVEYPNKMVWYDCNQIEELELAYAMTVHKSQGSEFKIVIIPVHELLMPGLSKNLLYTACTRAKNMVIIVGSKDAFSKGIRQTNEMERKSNLSTKIKQVVN